MKEKILNWIGFSLLAACFVISVGRIMVGRFQPTVGDQEGVTIRFAHWQLEGGVRDALDEIAKAYMGLHPHVRVVQIPVPEKIYTNWLITQLVGGTPPDIIQIGVGANDERIARFFEPLTDLAETANPYNVGTDLEGVKLRDTLFDGMLGGYREGLLEYYGVPISGYSVRMFYNLDLLEEITGNRDIPQTYNDLIALCERTREFARETGRGIVPIAGSKYNAPMLMERLFSSQTQRMSLAMNPPGVFEVQPIDRAGNYLRGEWSLDSPEVRSGIRLKRTVGQYMQPGFMQLLRDDATLLFVQGGALMICTGSWDATSIRKQARFPVVVGPIPLPSTDDPQFGEFTLGGVTEAGINAGVTFGITQATPHPEVAKDFLMFLASRRANQIWTDVSGWIPAVLGVEVDDSVEPFLPIVEGFAPGFPLASQALPDTKRAVDTQMHVLVGPFGSEDAFVEAIRESYGPSIRQSLARTSINQLDASRRADIQFGASAWNALRDGGDENRIRRFEILRQAILTNDLMSYRIRRAAYGPQPSTTEER